MCKNLDNSSAQGNPIEKKLRSKIWAKMTAEIPNNEKTAIFSKILTSPVKIFTWGFSLFTSILAPLNKIKKSSSVRQSRYPGIASGPQGLQPGGRGRARHWILPERECFF
jgi:hypothetical protein